MPPLTEEQKKALEARQKKEQKQALIAQMKNILRVGNKGYARGEENRILNSDIKDKMQELAQKPAAYRAEHQACLDKYKDIKILGFKRMASFYLDLSGTEAAEKHNREFLTRLTTEEGCANFAKRCAADILSFDLSKCVVSDDINKNLFIYADEANTRKIELCWIVRDLLNEKEEYLDPDIRNALNDREKILQASGNLQLCAEISANKYYTVLPEMSTEAIKDLTQLEYSEDFENLGLDFNDERAFSRMAHGLDTLHDYATDETAQDIRAAGEMEKQGKLTLGTYAEDENGNRIPLATAFEKRRKGEPVTLKENEAVTEKLRDFISLHANAAENKITMPKKEVPEQKAVYDSFGDEALSAQGKGFQTECARLLKEMENAKLWYTGGSDAFKNITRLLKETAQSDTVPNREQSLEVMDKILGFCKTYVEDDNHKGTLKPREQKRLDAVNTVRESLLKKQGFLRMRTLKGETARFQSELGTDGAPLHGSAWNQAHYHTTDSGRKAAQYLDTIRSFKGEDGVMRELALDTEKTVNGLTHYAEDTSAELKTTKYMEEGVGKSLAKMALLEMVREERAAAKENGSSEKGKIESKLEELYAAREESKDWNKALVDVAGTDAIRTLADRIKDDRQNAAEFLQNAGYKKLRADVKTELIEKYGEAPEAPEAPAKAAAVGKTNKKIQQIEQPKINVPGLH